MFFCLHFRGHQAYLAGAPNYNFPIYKQLVHEVTQTFKKISDEIIDINNKLHTQHNLTDISNHIRTIQEAEKQKLETVCFY